MTKITEIQWSNLETKRVFEWIEGDSTAREVVKGLVKNSFEMSYVSIEMCKRDRALIFIQDNLYDYLKDKAIPKPAHNIGSLTQSLLSCAFRRVNIIELSAYFFEKHSRKKLANV